jgi:hypothetical protein
MKSLKRKANRKTAAPVVKSEEAKREALVIEVEGDLIAGATSPSHKFNVTIEPGPSEKKPIQFPPGGHPIYEVESWSLEKLARVQSDAIKAGLRTIIRAYPQTELRHAENLLLDNQLFVLANACDLFKCKQYVARLVEVAATRKGCHILVSTSRSLGYPTWPLRVAA